VSAHSLFITLEGIEGCGKSTQARLLATRLEDQHGRQVVLTREPGGTEVTRQIRELLADPSADLDHRAELLLFLADRAQHVSSVIKPALEAGAIVICDRYSDSTLAYQSYGRGHALDLVENMNAWASASTKPDITLWIDCDIETGVGRAARQTGEASDRFEAEPLDFHRLVRSGFAALAERDNQRIIRIEGDASIEAISADILAVVEARLR